MSKHGGGGGIRIAVASTSAVRRAGLEGIIRSHSDFHLAGSFGAVASLVSFARIAELDVMVIDSDSIRDLLLEPTSEAALVLLIQKACQYLLLNSFWIPRWRMPSGAQVDGMKLLVFFLDCQCRLLDSVVVREISRTVPMA